MDNTLDIMNKGMNCLVKSLGVVDAEHFISVIIREHFDYTKWQQTRFDSYSLDQINNEAVSYCKNHLSD